MKTLKTYILLCFVLLSNHIHAQQEKIDSIKHIIANTQQLDSTHIELLSQLYELSKRSNLQNAKHYIMLMDSISNAQNYKEGKGVVLNCEGNVLELQGKFDEGMEKFKEALQIFKEVGNKKRESRAIGNIGNMFLYKGKYNKALEYYFEAIEIQEKINDEEGKGNNYNNIGVAYFYLQNYDKAEEYWLYTLNTFENLGKQLGMAYTLNNLGMIFSNKVRDFQLAIMYYQQALDILTGLDDKKGMASAINNIAESYYHLKKYDQVLAMYQKALKLKDEINDDRGKAIILDNIGKLYFEMGKHKKAIETYKKCLRISEETLYLNEMMDAFENLSEVYEATGELDSALKYQKLFANIKDSIFVSENNKSIAEMETKYQTEKKEKENQLLKKENELKNATLRQKEIMEYAMGGGILALCLVAGLIFYQFRVKKKANTQLTEQKLVIEEKNEELNQLINEIEKHRDRIEEQNTELSKKNHDILSSIQYAKRIQESLLPADSLLQQYLPEHFVFYRPKDIVSGDFYWMEAIHDKVFWAAVDCTGHGVPGAFMSIVGSNGLKKIVLDRKIHQPSEILKLLTEYVTSSIKMTKEGETLKDGMDIALCCWDKKTNILQYAGAYNPLYLVRNSEMEIIKATKRPVGLFHKVKTTEFENHEIQLQKGDLLYTFSDGFADQFGGKHGKKYTYKQLKRFLLEIHSMPLSEQLTALETEFDTWKGNENQLDDVCIFGVKV